MSLTSHLDNSSSPIRKFLEERFPITRAVMREANAQLRKAETIRPSEPVPWGTMGMAFDYRARRYMTPALPALDEALPEATLTQPTAA